MPNRRIERGIKLAGIKLYEHGLLPLAVILDVLDYSRSTFFRTLKLWHETGDVVSARSRLRGRHRLLNYDDVSYLLLLVENNPDYFLDELLHLLETNRFISVHYTSIHRALERAGVSRKKLRKIAIERNELRRANFVHSMSQYTPHQLGFLDETSKDERTLVRGFGRAKRGRRAAKKGVFVRTSTEALLTLDGIVACKVVEGSITKELFLEWVEYNVVSLPILTIHQITQILAQLPKCSPFPGPLSILVMDNAKIHHGADVLELCEHFGEPHHQMVLVHC
jgi:transposase